MTATPTRYVVAWRLIVVAALAAGLYGLLPQLVSLRGSGKLLTSLQTSAAIGALIAFSTTFVAATLIYRTLALHKLSFKKTLLVQLAAMGANRLLPAGSGAIATNTAYLHRQRHSLTQAAAVVATNNALGAVGHMLLLVGIVLFAPHALIPHLSTKHLVKFAIIALVVVSLGILLSLLPPLRRKLQAFWKTLIRYRRHPKRLILALLYSVALTCGNVGCLWLCGQSLALHFSWGAALLALTAGIGVGTAIPTPGGLGGVEVGLYTGLLAEGITSSEALATTLLFRLITFWLPLLPGLLAWGYARQQKLLAS